MSTDIKDLQTRQKKQTPDNFPAMLKAYESEIIRALPSHMAKNASRFGRIALTAFRRTPKLAECDPRSVFAAVIQASQLGLEPDTLGRAYLIPYGGECQFIPGWKGLVELLNRSGQGTAWTGAVFEGDEFEYALGDSPFVTHRPAGEYLPERLTHAYAIGRPKGAEWPIIEVWTTDRVIKHRDRFNKVGKRHYSFQNMEMYARKVALLQVLKYMPMSPELTTTMELDLAGETTGQHLTTKDAIEGTWAPVPEEESTEEHQQVDSNGEIFDPQKHLSLDKTNQDGSYTKRPHRGKSASTPAPATTGDPLAAYVAGMKAATNLDELANARELANGPDAGLSPEQLKSLDGFYNSIEAKLKAGAAPGEDGDPGFGGME